MPRDPDLVASIGANSHPINQLHRNIQFLLALLAKTQPFPKTMFMAKFPLLSFS
jgi:hypothetical protein